MNKLNLVSLDGTRPLQCGDCRDGGALDFAFSYAFQPIIDLQQRTVFAHEALVRGPAGEGAMSVLARVNDSNRYRFDQACRVKAIEVAARLGMQSRLSINFLPNAIYRPEVCIRTTLQAAREHGFPIEQIIFETVESEQVNDGNWLSQVFREYRRIGFMTAIDDLRGAGCEGDCRRRGNRRRTELPAGDGRPSGTRLSVWSAPLRTVRAGYRRGVAGRGVAGLGVGRCLAGGLGLARRCRLA